jgi:hypothetical protein
MQVIKRDGVALAYEDLNPNASPIVFVHGSSMKVFTNSISFHVVPGSSTFLPVQHHQYV